MADIFVLKMLEGWGKKYGVKRSQHRDLIIEIITMSPKQSYML